MKKPIVCISDIHGCYETMLVLIERARAEWGEFDLYFLGDLIDRGPNSRAVVEYAMQNNIPTLKGNHEDLCLDFSNHAQMGYKAQCSDIYDADVWLWNGGNDTLDSWECELMQKSALPKNVLDWMQALPLFIIPDVPLDENGRKLLLSHTGYGLEANRNNWNLALWGRYDGSIKFAYKNGHPYDDGYFRVFGHTYNKEPSVTNTYANIDTGAAYRGYAHLTAFHWPSKKYIMQETIDS